MTSTARRYAVRRHDASVVIADADRRVRHSLAELVRLGGVNVAGAAADAGEALRVIDEQDPDLLVLDPQLPTAAAGAELLATVRRIRPSMQVLLMGWPARDDSAPPDLSYVSKAASPAELLRAILAALPVRR
ncbi:MAG TPA: response regulator [Candidatus Limnocylindria bacterium]|nr:response regulator [Candidatus Limnocylindria bacterium]